MRIKLPEKRIIAPWKTRIISLMQTKFTDGITVEDILKVYPTAPRKYLVIAINELVAEEVAEKTE